MKLATGALAAATALLVVALVPPPERAEAALGGLTSFQIDGDETGAADWKNPPATLLENTATSDVCGNGLLDPDQLDGKLDDLDLDAPNPTPGNVSGKADLCQVRRAVEAVPRAGGGQDIILYGAWRRFAASGAVELFWPIVGPAPGKADDAIIGFYGDDKVEAHVAVLRWDGDSWDPTTVPLPAANLDVAVDDPGKAIFGEFAVNLTAAGLWPTAGDCTSYSSDFVFSQVGTSLNAELDDYVGLAPVALSPCAELSVTKHTDPVAPSPSATFGYRFDRAGGEDVTPGRATLDGTLIVPDAPTDTYRTVLAGYDYRLTETAQPPGWTQTGAECDVWDRTTGTPITVDVSAGQTFPVTPLHPTHCRLHDEAAPTLTIEKVAEPADGTSFDFTATRSISGPVAPFGLADGETQDIAVVAGEDVTVTEQVPATWQLTSMDCVGDDDVGYDTATGTVTLHPEPGEQIVCVYANTQPPPTPERAVVLVTKTARGPSATFGYTVSGPAGVPAPQPATFSLTPPGEDRQAVLVTPDPSGSTYRISEVLEDGWQLADVSCRRVGGATGLRTGNGVDVLVAPGQVVACHFTNELRVEPASLTITKQTAPAGGTGFGFVAPDLDPGAFTLDDGQSRTYDDLTAGTYVVDEVPAAGWMVTGTCSDGTKISGGRATVSLNAGDHVVCTYQNTAPASITVTKDAQPDGPQDFRFTTTRNGAAFVGFALDDDADPVSDPSSGRLAPSITGPRLLPGVYTITEAAVPGWRLKALRCTGNATTDLRARTAVVRVGAGEQASCRFTNARTVSPNPPDGPASGALPEVGAGDLRIPFLVGFFLLVAGTVLIGQRRASSLPARHR